MSKKLLVIEDEATIRAILQEVFSAEGYQVAEAEDGETGLKLIGQEAPDLVLLDQRLPGQVQGMDILKTVKAGNPDLPMIMVTGYGDVKTAVDAVKLGAYDFITKPFDNEELLVVVKRALNTKNLLDEVKDLKARLGRKEALGNRLIGNSKGIQEVLKKVETVAATDFTVLVQGESGTGKEVVAGLVYDLSKRQDRPFVHVDCGIIPENLIESELFGYEKGAFTGATGAKEGQFELADTGTIFLDEIGNLPYAVQSKLLRVLQNRKIRRLGGKNDKQVDVRIIAATNADLAREISDNQFRSDLFYRLSEFVINIPALAQRREDIPDLVEHFHQEVKSELDKDVKGFTREAMQKLVNHTWPGNVRELRNVVRNAILMAGEWVGPDDLIFSFGGTQTGPAVPSVPALANDKPRPLKEITKGVIEQVEKEVIENELQRCSGNKSKVARALEIDYKTLLSKIKSYQISK